MNIRIPAAAAAFALLLTACGGDADTAPSADASDVLSSAVDDFASADSAEELEAAGTEAAEEIANMADELESQQTGGSASITVGDQTWEFDGALCAFGEEEIGQEGAEFVLSSIKDGLQLYLSIDSFGHSASINDVEDFENPSVSWETEAAGEFIQVSGKDVTGETDFVDYTSETLETAAGNFEATCP